MTFVIWLTLVVVLIIISLAAEPRPLELSPFEIKRRQAAGDKQIDGALAQLRWRSAVTAWFDIVRLLAVVAMLLLTVNHWGFGWGLGVAVLIILLHPLVAKLKIIRRLAGWCYHRVEILFHKIFRKFPRLGRLCAQDDRQRQIGTVIASKEELAEVIAKTKGVLSAAERQHLSRALSFTGKVVQDIMAPRSEVETIADNEVLGPLVLDRLHALKQAVIPVTEGNSAKIIGVLRVKDNLKVSDRLTSTVRDVMLHDIEVVRPNDSLASALDKLRQAHQDLAVVVDQSQDPVGVVSLDTILEEVL